MTSANLDNLVKTGQLKAEPRDAQEIAGLLQSARARLVDARNGTLALESRFDLAYNASHALALAALRRHGYRADSRYLVFQTLPHTLGLPPATWRVLAHCHNLRNRGEYEGLLDLSEALIAEQLVAVGELQAALERLLA